MVRKVIGPELLTPGEVAALWKVDAKTVVRWSKQGKLQSLRTPGGTRRFYRAEVEALLNGTPLTDAELAAVMAGGAS